MTDFRTHQSPPVVLTNLRHYRPLEILAVAALYVVFARVSQVFAIEPGNVTPFWIPSGLMVALALYRGPVIWPGVFLGAFGGNIWAYIQFDSPAGVLAAVASASFNGVGDVLSTVVMAQFIVRLTGSCYPFTAPRPFVIYALFAVLLGPFISAVFGITGMVLFGHLESAYWWAAVYTWFVGDGVGALVFGPLILSWLFPTQKKYAHRIWVFLVVNAVVAVNACAFFGLIDVPQVLAYGAMVLIPGAFYLVINYEQRLAFTAQALLAFVAVSSIWLNVGPLVSDSQTQSLLQLQLYLAVSSFMVYVIAVVGYERESRLALLESQKSDLEHLYRKDQLTGLWNRYRLSEFIQRELALFKRDLRPFGVMLIDVDDFKLLNDSHGHLAGDTVLVELARLLETHTRESDLLGRWGGEEFVVVVHHCNKSSLQSLGQKICERVAAEAFTGSFAITVSIGATLVQANDTELTLLDRADEALYASKARGKNQITLA
ncbi:diguanylate cyclase [Simiduia sp. 21SJ11W-1]|uniref:sensor domain-containing diguanylate cyclase n=1 Tax=Simiduia sp. 21SJ11W-1 TaxID=2909669 RepID=UPI00209DFF3A|nr:diguanylate cyclase [Simiduia sp. 21SJ11W-1]UTA49092.1 diguanylate cyclase [Simiduia sp. 21SJ11W-1]